ncbi:MAG TPA: oligosaccharide flippase family protein [Ilumatobacteraceae bacterium]|nr:oligosaccharide flippase family protein [Ilumatobacteraceae bacterium]
MTVRTDEPDRLSGAAVARSMTAAAAGHGAGQVTWFLSLIVLGALLDPQAFGTVAAGLVVVNSATLLMGAGTGGSIVSTPRLAPGQIRSSMRLNLALGAVMTAVLVVAAGPITESFASGGDPRVLQWLAPAIALHAVTVVPIALLRKQMQFGRQSAATFVAYTVAGATAVVLGVLGAGVWSLVVRMVLFEGLLAVASVALAWQFLRGQLQSVEGDGGSRREGGTWFFVLALANFVAFNADYLIVGRFTDAEQLGLYSLAFLIAFAPLRQFSWQIGGVLFSASAASDDIVAVRKRLATALRLGSSLMLPFVVPSVVLAPVVLPAVLGDDWSAMVPAFQILVVAGVFHAVLNIGAEFLSGTGNIDVRGKLALAWAVGMVGLLLVVVPRHGLVGAAWVHLALFVPLAVVTAVLGARRLSATMRELLMPMATVVGAVSLQVVFTVACIVVLEGLDVSDAVVAVVSASAGLVVVGLSLSIGEDAPWPSLGRVIRRASGARTAAPGR